MSIVPILWLISCGHHVLAAIPEDVYIGIIFDSDDFLDEIYVNRSIDQINKASKLLPKSNLRKIVENITHGDTFKVTKKAILGPSSVHNIRNIQSLCDNFNIPHIEINEDFKADRNDEFFLIEQLISVWKWEHYAILYEDSVALIRMKEMLHRYQPNEDNKVIIHQLDSKNDYGYILKMLKKIGETNIIVDCSLEKITPLLRMAKNLNMLTPYHHYFLINWDAHILNLQEFTSLDLNVTTIKITKPSSEETLHSLPEMTFRSLYFPEIRLQNAHSTLKLNQALLYDGIQLFAKALDNFGTTQDVRMEKLSCDAHRAWKQGRSFLHSLRETEFSGLTGKIQFDSRGFRSSFDADIVRFRRDGSLIKLASWNQLGGINYTLSYKDIYSDIVKSLETKLFVVSIVETPPYIKRISNGETQQTNDNFEGFSIDMIEEISRELKFNYTLKLAQGNKYGVKNPQTKEWNGIIRELIDWAADLAIVDLTITHERQEAVDFSTPFMSLGISILYKKQAADKPSLFSFLSPFSPAVWFYVITVYMAVSILLYLNARMCSKEWRDPSPCSQDKTWFENKFTITNCFWYTIGSLMQQGCDIAPTATPTRLISVMWAFFTMIIVQSYTANLTAFLTISRMDAPITSIEDLVKHTRIKYGCMEGGSTFTFFKNSKIEIYQKMFLAMESQKPTVFTKSNQEGVDRVLKSNGEYAFFMESTSIEYYVEGNCELQQIGGLLDSKNYGIAMPKNSPYIEAFNMQILKLQQENRLQLLKDKWWKKKRPNVYCEKETTISSGSATELRLANVGGVFVILLFGSSGACVVAAIEFLWKCRCVAYEKRRKFCAEMREELSFVFKCTNSKSVAKKSQDISENTVKDPMNVHVTA